MGEIWRFEMLGGLTARQGDRTIRRFPTRKAASLLARLAYRPEQICPREQLIAEFWPDTAPKAAHNSLRQTLHLLRGLLEPNTSPPLFRADRTTLQLIPEAFETDTAHFAAHLGAARSGGTAQGRQEHALRAVDLYRGELLSGYYDEWIFPERRHWEAAYQHTLQEIVTALEADGEPLRAVEYALRLIAVNPLEEEAHTQAIRLYAAAGQTARAAAQYRQLEHILQEEFGEDPSPALQQRVQDYLGKEGSAKRPHLSPAFPLISEAVQPLRQELPTSLPPPDAGLESENVPCLPTPLTRFFGREAEITELTRRLIDPRTRLLTLTGVGGTGKTRLAIEIARQVAGHYHHAVYFVPLAALPDARFVPDAIAEALRLPHQTHGTLLDQIVRHLSQTRTLVLLDNFETVAEEGAACVLSLLQRIAPLTCLVTSQHSLNIEGEAGFPVTPLPVPVAGEATSPASAEALLLRLTGYACVQLFLDRARSMRPGFQLTAHNAPDLAAVCAQLEGVPLAIELAAARIGALSLSQMRTQLQNRLDFLVSRRADLSARHRSLRAAIEWSYRLLSPELERYSVRLAVFQGGWTLEAAEAVVGTPDTLSLLEQLRERSLIQAEETATGLRFTMLETLRAYGKERWTAEEAEEIRERHARYFAELCRHYWYSPEGRERSPKLSAEWDNLHLALEWLIPHDVETAARTALGGYSIYQERQKLPVVRLLLERILTAAPEGALSLQTQAEIYYTLACCVGTLRDTAAAHTYALKNLAILEELNKPLDQCLCIRNLMVIAKIGGDYDAALAYGARYRNLAEKVGNRYTIANAAYEIGSVLQGLRRLEEAEACFRESLERFRALGYPGRHPLEDLGALAFVRGDWEQAVALYREALADGEEPTVWWLLYYGCALAFTTEPQARERGCESVRKALQQEIAEHEGPAGPFHCLPFQMIARLAHEVLGDADLAARLLGAHVREQQGEFNTPLSVLDTTEVANCAASVERVLGKQAFNTAYAAGLALPWYEMTHLTLQRLPTF